MSPAHQIMYCLNFGIYNSGQGDFGQNQLRSKRFQGQPPVWCWFFSVFSFFIHLRVFWVSIPLTRAAIWTLWRGHWCLMIHWFSHKAHVNVKSEQVKAIKAALRLSRHHVHALVFKVGLFCRSLSTTKPIVKEALIHLGHQCLTIRLTCVRSWTWTGNSTGPFVTGSQSP